MKLTTRTDILYDRPRPCSLFPLCDAHAHVGTTAEQLERKEQNILSFISIGTPEEASSLNFPPSSSLFFTYGLHPWHADKFRVSDMEMYFEKCDVIGEIGMDSVWCSIPLSIQEQVFREQLSIAKQLQKPVVLHTKGQEKEIFNIIKDFANTYLVHWYSCSDYLKEYLSLDCFFSIGPDVRWNPAVRRVAALVPSERLLVETDGLDAVKWAYEDRNEPCPITVRDALHRSLNEIAAIRGLSTQETAELVKTNILHFLRQQCSI